MPVLYVTEQRSIIRKTGDRLVVEKQGEVLMEVPCLKHGHRADLEDVPYEAFRLPC